MNLNKSNVRKHVPSISTGDILSISAGGQWACRTAHWSLVEVLTDHLPKDQKIGKRQSSLIILPIPRQTTNNYLLITDHSTPNHSITQPACRRRQSGRSPNHPITQSLNLPAEDDSQAGHSITQSPNHENNIINTANWQHTAFAAR